MGYRIATFDHPEAEAATEVSSRETLPEARILAESLAPGFPKVTISTLDPLPEGAVWCWVLEAGSWREIQVAPYEGGCIDCGRPSAQTRCPTCQRSHRRELSGEDHPWW